MSFQNVRAKNLGLYLLANARAGGQSDLAYQFASDMPGGTIAAAATLKAAALTTATSPGADLGALSVINNEFLGPVRERTVLGQVGRAVPGRTRILGPASGLTSAWVGEGQPVQISGLSLDYETVDLHKVVAMLVSSNELIASTSPDVPGLLVDDLTTEAVRTLNTGYLDLNNAGVPGVMPASITCGAPWTTATGDFATEAGVSALRSDVRRLFDTYRGSWDRACIIASTRTACSFAMARVLDGVSDYIPIITGSVPGDGASPETDILVIADRGSLRYVTPVVEFEASRQGNLVLSGAGPDVTTPAPKSSVSLFQADAVATKVSITTGWNIPPVGHVAVLTNIPRE